MMVIGFFEKIAVADLLGVAVNKVYENIGEANGLLVLVATILFSIQILCDFKGYSDIAKGVARIYGIRLSDNFDKPYGARSVREFWRKWHITLSYWFRDYLYIPLGGSRVKFPRYCFNILLVFAVSGLWHGAAVTFILWGVFHAVCQICEKIAKKIHEPKESLWSDVLRTCLTFTLVTLAWILFRSNSLSDCGAAFAKLFTDWHFGSEIWSYSYSFLDLSWRKLSAVGAVLAVYFGFAPLLKAADKSDKKIAKVLKVCVFSIMMIMTVGCFLYLKSMGVDSSFIYFQF